jgi:polyphosphate kinase
MQVKLPPARPFYDARFTPFIECKRIIMADHSANGGKPRGEKTVVPRRQSAGPRLVAAGDILAKSGLRTAEADRVARRTSTKQTVQATVVSELLSSLKSSPPSETLHQLQSLIGGASPDELKALRRTLFAKSEDLAMGVDPDLELSEGWREGVYPYKNLMSRKNYEKQKFQLQVELLKLQAWVKESGQRVVILFEGRDAAGKGGTIKRLMEHLNPRGARVVALEKPSETERGQWYFQRYIQHLPTRGEIVLFDRSWYNRAGVERVMGFCNHQEYDEFLRQCPEFERQLVRSGVHLFKFWFSVSRDEQHRRFRERRNHPLKQWKLSPVDMASLDKWWSSAGCSPNRWIRTTASSTSRPAAAAPRRRTGPRSSSACICATASAKGFRSRSSRNRPAKSRASRAPR